MEWAVDCPRVSISGGSAKTAGRFVLVTDDNLLV